MADFTLPVPEDWRRAEQFYRGAHDRALTALKDPRTLERLTRYYERTSNFAGAMFTDLLPDTSPDQITERDLLAVSLLDVPIPPKTVYTLLQDGEARDEISTLLARVPVDVKLSEVDADLLGRMDDLYQVMRGLVPPPGRDRYAVNWVMAAKLCARKRPHLFPVRDEIVCRYLGLWPSRYQIDWQVFAHIIADDEVVDRLTRLVERADESEEVEVGDPTHLLRHLDVVLWMHAPHRPDR